MTLIRTSNTRTANTRTANIRTANTRRRWTVLGAAALAFASLSLAQPTLAAPAAGSVPIFGSVDINQLQEHSTRKTKYDTDLHAMADRLDATFKQQAQSLMLSNADQTELGTLLNNPHPTDADRAQITALETKASQAADQLIALQQKKDPTPADTAQLGMLTDMNNNGQRALQDIGAGYQAQLKTLSDNDNKAFTQAVKDAIAAVAREHGLTMVFTSDVAVFTTNDITDDVVKRINK
jgi:Skp family chaperone for outer membrane proteins